MAETLTFSVIGRGDASDVERLAAAIEDLTRDLQKLDKTKAEPKVDVDTKQAERNVGRFASDLQRKISKAVESLPDIELDADATDAQRELAGIRSQLAELNGQRIGVDIDAADAERQMRALQERLTRLSAESADIQVQADTAAAVAALGVVKTEADKIDGRKVTVKVATDRGLSDAIVKVAALGRALGTLAIPAALVVAAPQIAAIGAAALDASGALALIPAAGAAAATAIGTLVVGMQGFGDALKNRDDAEKFAEAIKELSPAAREAAVTIRDLGSAWDKVRLDVQERLFENVGQSIQRLSGSYLPVLSDVMGRVADHFNYAFVQVERFLTTESTIGKLRTAFSGIENGIENALDALQPLTEAFVSLVSVGASRLPALGQAVANVADRFRDWIVAAERSGDLGRWIDQGIASIQQLGRIAGDVGSSLGTIFRIADQEGAGFLTTVERITSAIQQFTSSAQGQETIANVFRTIRETVDAAWPGVQALGQAIVDVVNRLSNAGVFQAVAAAFTAIAQAVAPVVTTLGNLAAAVLPPLLSALQTLAPVLVPVAAGLLAVAAAAKVANIIQALGTRVTGFVGALRAAEGGVGKFRTVLGGLAGALGVGGPLGLAITAAITAGGLLAGAWAESQAAAADMKARIDALADSLNSYTGAATEATRAQIAQEVGTNKLADGTTSYAQALQRAGVDTKDFVDATTGNEAALQKVRTQLDSHVATLIKASPAYANSAEQLGRMGISLEDLAAAAQGNQPAMDRINDAINRSSAGSLEARSELEMMRDSLLRTGGASAEMGRELNRMAGEYGQAAQQARDAGAANLVFADVLEAVGAGFAGIAAGAKPTEEMTRRLTDLGAAADIAAKSAGDSAAELTGLAGGAAAAGASMAESRDAFIEAATAAGIAAPQAEELAKQIGLIPSAASIIFQTNATGVQAEMITLNERIKALPPNTSITVTDLSAEARANLETLGFTIGAIPGTKDVKVTAPTDQAKASLDAFVALANGTTVTITGDMNVDAATNKITQTVTLGNGQTAVMTYDANASAADGKIHATVTYGNGQTATLVYNANPDPATGQINAVVTYADGSTGTVTINPNDLVTPTIDQLKNPSASTHTINPNPAPVDAAKTQAQTPTASEHTINPNTGPVDTAKTNAQGPTQSPHTVGSPTTDNTQGPRTTASAPTANPHTVGSPTDTGPVDGAKTAASQPTRSLHTFDIDDHLVTEAKSRAEQPTRSLHTIDVNDQAVRDAKRAAENPTSSTHTIHIVTVGGLGRAVGAYVTPRAEGAYTSAAAYANGGMRTMSAARAEIVPPRQPRVIGDRMRGDEAFIPVNRSPWSRAILSTTAQRMGYDLVPRAMASGGVLDQVRAAAAGGGTRGLRSSDGGALGGELRQIGGLLRALRGDVDHHADNLGIIGELRAVRVLLARAQAAGGSAAATAQASRTVAELGAF